MTYSQKETNRIRSLADKVAAIAREPRMAAIKKRWADVNALRKPDRAPVWCRPVGCWKEIIPYDTLLCADPMLRQMEYGFLKLLHKRDIGDDEPVEDFFALNAVFDREPANIRGVDIGRHSSGEAGGAWAYDPPLRQPDDFLALKMPRFRYREDKTLELKARIEDLLGNIMPVKAVAGPLLSATLGTAAADLRGLEQMMVDMITDPVLMHKLMAHLRDANLSALDQLEATGLITPNNTGSMRRRRIIKFSSGENFIQNTEKS